MKEVMENDILISLSEIKTILYILMGIFIVGVVLVCFVLYIVGVRFLSYKKSDEFKFFVEEKLDKGLYNEVICDAKEFLKDRPYHTYAQWYLAKAYYYTDDFENARLYFEKILKREPDWVESVEPYLDKIIDSKLDE